MDKSEEFSKCFVCDHETNNSGRDMFNCVTDYSQTLMFDVLEKAAGHELKVSDPNKCVVCFDCTEKINEYDLACTTALRVQRELSDMMLQTSEKYTQAEEVLEVAKDGDDQSIEHIILADEIYPIKDEPQALDHEPLEEETDEYEIQFFTSTNDNDEYTNEVQEDEMQDQHEFLNIVVGESRSTRVTETNTPPLISKPPKSPVEEKRSSKPRRSTFCKICKIDYNTFKELSEHRKEKHDDGQRLVCDICGVRYKTQSALNIHIDMHNGISPFKCETCGKKFTQKGALKRHKPIHTGERPYQCDKCGKQFTHYSSFHMHNLAHDDIRDKKCEICGLLLRSSSHLNRHMLVHTGQKPHACPKCGQRFAQRYNMMSHLRSHQGIHRKKKFICNICSKGFTKEVLLQKHQEEKNCKMSEDNVYHIIDENDTPEYTMVVKKASLS